MSAQQIVSAAEAEMAVDEFHGYYLEDLQVGQSASYAKTVTETDIVLFAGISGDANPIHLNQEFAMGTDFGSTIAHGLLSAGFISTVLGTKLPGPGCIYLSQNLKFKAPVRAGDTVVARAEVTEIDAVKGRVSMRTQCIVKDTVVIDGNALMLVSRRDAST